MPNFSDEELTVYYKDEPVLRLNRNLVERQKINRRLVMTIKELHVQRLDIEHQLQTCRVEDKRVLFECWTEVQHQLQRAWGFPEDSKFHRFWDMLGCECPKMDNSDNYPHGMYYINQSCPIHGKY